MIKKQNNNSGIYMTQQELATRWKISESSVTNYRSRGILPFFRVPGSTRILYPVAEIEQFEKENIHRKEVIKKKKTTDNKGEKYVISAKSSRNWRI